MLVVDSVVSTVSYTSESFQNELFLATFLRLLKTLFYFSLQVPGGPAHKHLETGDVLVRVNGEVSPHN